MANLPHSRSGTKPRPGGPPVVGCCTALLDRPFFARVNLLQVASQTVRPNYHSIVASGPEFDCRFLEDLMDDTTLFTCLPHAGTTLDCFTLSLRELYARGVNLFICLDHDCIYKRPYIESVCRFVTASQLDLERGLFCLNLVNQEWVTLYDDARADIEERSFAMGHGLSEDEAKRMVVGAPPTFAFGRGAAAILIDHAAQGANAPSGYHDMFWRRTLLEAGIRITQVQTPEPVFAYVRHTNNLCWDGKPVGMRPAARLSGPVALLPARPRRARAIVAGSNEMVDVTVVVPTYNEGAWLSRTVESIRDAETDLRFEILVANDGCTDGSIEALAPGDDLRIVPTGGEQLGLIVAKNTGARAARGKYLCFLDSHVLVRDHWLDCLRETCDAYPDGALVSGNLPDAARPSEELEKNQYCYIIRNCLLGTGWHFYGKSYWNHPYVTPLTPGGLMFTQKAHFARLGGFASSFRKWGAEDIQISLQNYYVGGESVVDPRVIVYHSYKGGPHNKRTFTISNAQHGFNCLHVASAYFPHEFYLKVRNAIVTRCSGRTDMAEEIESDDYQRRLAAMRSEFVRGFEEWSGRFAVELGKFFEDVRERSVSSAASGGEAAGQGLSLVAGQAG